MRVTILVPLAVMLCACSKKSDKSGLTRAPDSAVTTAAPVVPASSAAHPSQAAAQPSLPSRTDCGIKGQPVLKDFGVGDLEVGRTTAVIKNSCNVIRDASESGVDGNVERVLTVKVGDILLGATVANDLILRIAVTNPSLATPDGLHVGVPLSRLASVAGAKLAEGEDGLYVMLPSHCGLSFRFSVQSRAPNGRPWNAPQLVQRYGQATSNRILVTRCEK